MEKLDSYLIWFLIFLIFCFILSILIVVLDGIFVLIFPPSIINFSPERGGQNVSLNSSLVINFDKPIKRREIQISISPEAHGEWKFKNPLIKSSKEPLLKTHFCRTLVFVPAIDFEPDTQYQVKLNNIKGFGFLKSNSFQFTFKTRSVGQTFSKKNEEKTEDEEIEPSLIAGSVNGQKTAGIKEEGEGEILSGSKPVGPNPEVTMLEISLDWQDHNLSCEAASLKMALAGKGVFVSEDQIIKKIGYDLTPRRKDVWGDPYQKYVGDINGKVCETGFGVFWGPIAKAARNWEEAKAFSGWEIEDLTREIEAGNPVVVWGVLPTGTLTDCSWYTAEGKYILAFKETHVRVVIGFIGFSNQPSEIILNDPVAGRLYWSTLYFLKNWKVFNYSGVVIR